MSDKFEKISQIIAEENKKKEEIAIIENGINKLINEKLKSLIPDNPLDCLIALTTSANIHCNFDEIRCKYNKLLSNKIEKSLKNSNNKEDDIQSKNDDLKILAILFTKRVDIFLLYNTKNVEAYNRELFYLDVPEKYHLATDEYDLLKNNSKKFNTEEKIIPYSLNIDNYLGKTFTCLKRIDEKNYLTEREHKEFYNIVETALAKHKALKRKEVEIGCPLEVRCNVYTGVKVFSEEGKKYNVTYTYKDGFITDENRYFYWKNFQKNWWLNENKEVKD